MKLNFHDPKQRGKLLLGAAALGLLVALYLRHRATAATTATTATVGATTDPTALNGYGTTTGVPTVLDTSGAAGATGVAAVDPTQTDALAAATASLTDAAAAIIAATTPLTDPGIAPYTVPPTTAPVTAAAATPKTAAGVWWGGKFMTSIKQLVSYEKAHGNSGFDANAWAAQHPDAARTLGVTPPPPMPRAAQPSASAPVHATPVSGVGKATPAASIIKSVAALPAARRAVVLGGVHKAVMS